MSFESTERSGSDAEVEPMMERHSAFSSAVRLPMEPSDRLASSDVSSACAAAIWRSRSAASALPVSALLS